MVKDKENTRITDIASSSPHVLAKQLGYSEKAGNSVIEIEVTVLPGMPLGRINETVTVHSNLENKPKTVLRVGGYIQGDVEISPKMVTFVVSPKSPPKGQQKRMVIISNYKDTPLEIISVKDPDGLVGLILEPHDEGKRFGLQVTLLKNNLPKGRDHYGKVIITTNNEEFEKIEVPYKILGLK